MLFVSQILPRNKMLSGFSILAGKNFYGTLATLLTAILATGIFFLIVVSGLVPNIDVLIYDYNEEVEIGGNLDPARAARAPRRISPRGALFLDQNNA